MTRQTKSSCGLAGWAPLPCRRTAATRTAAAQTVRVVLGWQRAHGILTLIATTLKRGTSYQESWSITPDVAVVVMTVLERSMARPPSYVSRAVVADHSLTPDTTYTVSYAIVMRTAESTWAGSGSVTVTIGSHGSPTVQERTSLADR